MASLYHGALADYDTPAISRAGVSWRLDSFDVRGRTVATWNRPLALPNGVHWILLRQGEERMARPVVLVRR